MRIKVPEMYIENIISLKVKRDMPLQTGKESEKTAIFIITEKMEQD